MTTSEAVQQLEAWASPNFTVADAALRDTHPAQHAVVFAKNLKARRGSAGVLAVQTFLARLDGLGGKDREAHRADDHTALVLLGERGITAAERARVRGLVDIAQKGIARPATSSAESPSIAAAKLALYVWHKEWSTIARTVISRRDHLIRMDLATRQKPKKKPDAKVVA